MEDISKKQGFAEAAAGAVVCALVAGLHWPRFFPVVFFAGLLLSRPLLGSAKRLPFLWAWLLLVVIYHLGFEILTYPFLFAANPAYFITAAALGAFTFLMCLRGKPLAGFYALVALMLPGQMLTGYKNPAIIFASILFILLAVYSGELRKVNAAAAALAVFHCFLISGLATFSHGDFGAPVEIHGDRLDHLSFPAFVNYKMPAGEQFLLNLKGKKTGAALPGVPAKVLIDKNKAEVFVLLKGSRGSGIAVFDNKTLKLKRESFAGACGAGDVDFDIDPTGKFIACARGSNVAILDTEMLEWLDVEDAGLKGPSRLRFGAPGTLYATDMRDGFLLKMRYDQYGHNLKISRKKNLGRGILSMAVYPDRGILAAGNALTGEVLLLSDSGLVLVNRGMIAPAVRISSLYTEPDFLLFYFLWLGAETHLRVKPEYLMGNGLRPVKGDYGAAAFLIMPVRFWRSAR